MATVVKKESLINNLRLDLLKTVDEICSENGLTYFCYSNLLIGAVHYHDFLPGGLSKSMEIGLLRKDYKRLYEIACAESKKHGFTVRDRFASGAKMLNFVLERDFIIESEELEYADKIKLEISPLDYVPDTPAQQKTFFRKLKKLRSRYLNMVNLLPKNPREPMKIKEATTKFWCTLIYSWRSPKKTYNKLISFATSVEKSGYIRKLMPEYGVLLPVEDVFPLKKEHLENIEIPLPNNTYHWTALLDDELMERTKTIQKIDLVILKEFDRVCREIGVGYFICGGTMLGCMRHKGFIPWDDDADVGMLRADYDKFIREAPKYLNEDFFLQTRKSDPKIPYLFSKIRMNETEYITNYNELRDFHKGICLDLFPFDYIPNNMNEAFKFQRSVKTVERLHNLVANNQLEKPVYTEKAKDKAERKARRSNEFHRKLWHLIPLKLTQRIYINKATRYNKKAKENNLTTVASFVPTYTFAKIDDMLPYQDVDFEGLNVMALKDMDSFLTMQYGDYMKLPDQHQRVGHDLINWGISDRMAEKYHIYDDDSVSANE